MVFGSFNERKVIGTKVHADLVAIYCSFSERKLTESETSLAIQHSSQMVAVVAMRYDAFVHAHSVTPPTVYSTKFS